MRIFQGGTEFRNLLTNAATRQRLPSLVGKNEGPLALVVAGYALVRFAVPGSFPCCQKAHVELRYAYEILLVERRKK